MAKADLLEDFRVMLHLNGAEFLSAATLPLGDRVVFLAHVIFEGREYTVAMIPTDLDPGPPQ